MQVAPGDKSFAFKVIGAHTDSPNLRLKPKVSGGELYCHAANVYQLREHALYVPFSTTLLKPFDLFPRPTIKSKRKANGLIQLNVECYGGGVRASSPSKPKRIAARRMTTRATIPVRAPPTPPIRITWEGTHSSSHPSVHGVP